MRRGLTRVGVGIGARVVPRVGVVRRLGVNVGRDVNTAGSPELEGRGAGASGGTGVSPSRGACLTTIFTTPVLFTMDDGTARGSHIERKVENKQRDPKDAKSRGKKKWQTDIGDTGRRHNTEGRLDTQLAQDTPERTKAR